MRDAMKVQLLKIPDQTPEARLLEVECVSSAMRKHIIRSRTSPIGEINTLIDHCIGQLVAARKGFNDRAMIAEMAACLEASL